MNEQDHRAVENREHLQWRKRHGVLLCTGCPDAGHKTGRL